MKIHFQLHSPARSDPRGIESVSKSTCETKRGGKNPEIECETENGRVSKKWQKDCQSPCHASDLDSNPLNVLPRRVGIAGECPRR